MADIVSVPLGATGVVPLREVLFLRWYRGDSQAPAKHSAQGE